MTEIACIGCRNLFEPYRLFRGNCAKCALDRAARVRKEKPLPPKQWSLGEEVPDPEKDPFEVPEPELHRCAHEGCKSLITGRRLFCWGHAEQHGHDKLTGQKKR